MQVTDKSRSSGDQEGEGHILGQHVEGEGEATSNIGVRGGAGMGGLGGRATTVVGWVFVKRGIMVTGATALAQPWFHANKELGRIAWWDHGTKDRHGGPGFTWSWVLEAGGYRTV